jgi:uncharacterized protein YjcR
MRKVERKNYSEEFRKKVLAACYCSHETVASWVRRDPQSEDQKKSNTFASSKIKSMNTRQEANGMPQIPV